MFVNNQSRVLKTVLSTSAEIPDGNDLTPPSTVAPRGEPSDSGSRWAHPATPPAGRVVSSGLCAGAGSRLLGVAGGKSGAC